MERWQDDAYNAHRILNGEEVDEDTFISAERLYGDPGAIEDYGIELTVWGFRTQDGKYERIMRHKEELNLSAIGYDPDAKPENGVDEKDSNENIDGGYDTDEEESDEILDGDYDTLRTALREAGFDVDTYGLDGFDVVVEAPDGYVNVREECGTEYPIITQLSNGTEVYIGECFVNSKGQLWGAITEPECIGYIALSQVQQVKR